MVKFVEVTGPAYWASYLINSDASGMEPEEKARADAWLLRNRIVNVVSTASDDDGESKEPRFTRHYQLYDPLADCTGGDVLDYVCELARASNRFVQ